VANIPTSTDSDAIKAVFAAFGNIVDFKVPQQRAYAGWGVDHKALTLSKNEQMEASTATITFETEAIARTALGMNDFDFCGQKLSVSLGAAQASVDSAGSSVSARAQGHCPFSSLSPPSVGRSRMTCLFPRPKDSFCFYSLFCLLLFGFARGPACHLI
jgi:hypothetical protein